MFLTSPKCQPILAYAFNTLAINVSIYIFHIGSILEGPEPTNLKPIVEQAMPMMINLLKDPSIAVRDTAAWTVGRVCEIVSEAVINEQYLTPLLEALVEGLSADPRVASNVCWVSM